MNRNTPVRNTNLADQVLNILVERISQNSYLPGSKLPPENMLAEELNVSRSTIRTAISRLEDRKLIHRRPGVGTYVTDNPNISNPLNEFIEFPKLIEENGYKPGFLPISSEIIEPDDSVTKDLLLNPGDKVLKIQKVFTANEDPIIYVVNLIPCWIFQDVLSIKEVLQPNITRRFKYFFEVLCRQQVSHFISTVRASIIGNADLPTAFIDYSVETPLLIINEIGYNLDERPIVSSCEYHPGNWMTFRMVRRWG